MKRVPGLTIVILMLAMLGLCMPVLADGSGQGPVLGGDFYLEAGQVHDDDLVVLGGTAHLKPGSVLDGDLAVMGGQVVVEGRVLGDIVSFGGSLTLGEQALVEGDVIALAQLNRHPGSTVEGKVVQGLDSQEGRDQLAHLLGSLPKVIRDRADLLPLDVSTPVSAVRVSPLGGMARRFGVMLALLLVALVAMTMLPSHMQQIETFMTGSWSLSLAVGVLSMVLGALLVPLLIVICIGLPVAIVLALALLLAGLMGWVAAGKFLAGKLLPRLKIQASTPLAQALIGTFVITLLGMVPCVGSLFTALVLSWAIGAVVLTRFGIRGDFQWSAARSPGASDVAVSVDPTAIPEPPTAYEPSVTPTGPLAEPPTDTRRLDPDELNGEGLDQD